MECHIWFTHTPLSEFLMRSVECISDPVIVLSMFNVCVKRFHNLIDMIVKVRQYSYLYIYVLVLKEFCMESTQHVQNSPWVSFIFLWFIIINVVIFHEGSGGSAVAVLILLSVCILMHHASASLLIKTPHWAITMILICLSVLILFILPCVMCQTV